MTNSIKKEDITVTNDELIKLVLDLQARVDRLEGLVQVSVPLSRLPL